MVHLPSKSRVYLPLRQSLTQHNRNQHASCPTIQEAPPLRKDGLEGGEGGSGEAIVKGEMKDEVRARVDKTEAM